MTAAVLFGKEIPPDGAHAPCAACGVGGQMGKTRRTVEGVLIMLCDNAGTCAMRYRRGLSPATYAARIRNGSEF